MRAALFPMALDPADLSVAAIRAELERGERRPSPKLLQRLREDPRQGVRRLAARLERMRERELAEGRRTDALLARERGLWRAGLRLVAGIDEVGMGPIAGPVVAAAVVFPPGTALPGIDDSKKLDARTRERLAGAIRGCALGVGIGRAEPREIDELNVHQAGLLAMRRALEALPERPEHVLVDARTIPGIDVPQEAHVGGDALHFSIAAASIVAKTFRDALMVELDREHAGYGFAAHKGYCTRAHQEAVRRLGPTPVHRMSYPFLRELEGRSSELFYRLRERLAPGASAEDRLHVEAALRSAGDALAGEESRKLRALLARRRKTR